MPFLEVDPEGLVVLARRLDGAVDVAREVKDGRDGLKALAAAAGDRAVDGALCSFLDAWAHGCGCLVEDAQGLARCLGEAARVYVEVDAAAAGGFGGG